MPPVHTNRVAGVLVKVCGVTSPDDAVACVAAGVWAIGVNFVRASPRKVDHETARAIIGAVAGRALVVGVVADPTLDEATALLDAVGVDALQLHGDEPPSMLTSLTPRAYKAIRVGGAGDAALADRYGGDLVLVDARVEGRLGGTGRTVDPAIVEPIARRRKTILAGGLTPLNVARAIAFVRPYAVDVASGVEGAMGPRRKDIAAVHAFMVAAHGAAAGDP